MKGLLVDNYDSFTYNLYQYLSELNETPLDVYRNDQITVDEIKSHNYDFIVLSPGPGHPANSRDFGVCTEIIQTVAQTVPTLGICLGHQGIASCYGGKIKRSPYPIHGKKSIITHDGRGIFQNLPQNLAVGRYHSLIVDSDSISAAKDLEVTSVTEDGVIMSIKHKRYPIIGLQFHPESILTEHGKTILKSFLTIVKQYNELNKKGKDTK